MLYYGKKNNLKYRQGKKEYGLIKRNIDKMKRKSKTK